MNTETITFRGIDFDVEFEYQPEEPMVMYYPDGSGYPGCAAEYIIHNITFKNTCFMDMLEEHLDEIKTLLYEKRDQSD